MSTPRVPSRPSPAREGLALLAALALAACTHRSAEVVVVGSDPEPPPPGIPELEPNDDAWNADFIGDLFAHEGFAVAGHVRDDAGDPFDGFAFYAAEPMDVTFRLTAHQPWADLDLCLYDPFSDEWIACFESEANPEVGSLSIGYPGEFHVVVSSWYGDSSYTLEVDAWPLAPGPAGFAPASGSPFRAHGDTDDFARFEGYRAAPGEVDVIVIRTGPVPIVVAIPRPAPDA